MTAAVVSQRMRGEIVVEWQDLPCLTGRGIDEASQRSATFTSSRHETVCPGDIEKFPTIPGALGFHITTKPTTTTISMRLLNAPSSKDDMDTTVINSEERSFHKHRLAAVAEHERLLANTHPLPVRTLPLNKNDDTEPCFTGCSRIHRLVCGHIVYTHQPTLCGNICKTPVPNFAPFLCTLCQRWDMVRKGRVSRRSSSMSALILPDFPDVDQSQTPFILQARECYIVYRLHNGALFVPFSVEDMAMVRLLEKRQLGKLTLETMTDIQKTVGWSLAVVQAAGKALAACVEHQHLWSTATHDFLAVACLYATAERASGNMPNKHVFLAEYFNVSEDEVHEIAPAVTALLIDLDARSALASFVPQFEKMFPRLTRKAKTYALLAMKLWTKVNEQNVFLPDFLQKYWLRIVASCILAVMERNSIPVDIAKICATIGTSRFGDAGGDIDVEVAILMPGGEAYSMDDKSATARRARKLKHRVRLQTPQSLTQTQAFITLPYKPTTQLQLDFAWLALDEEDHFGDWHPKRRRGVAYERGTFRSGSL